MARTFPFFPHLPTEIRLQIYSLALPRRILEIHILPDPRISLPERPMNALTNFHAYESRRERPFFFKCLSPPPAMLSVNREAREEALKGYVVVRDDTPAGAGGMFNFDPERDTLWVAQHAYPDDWTMLFSRISKSSPGVQVRSLAICDDRNHGLYQPDFAERVRDCGIEQVFLVFEKREEEGIPCVWPLIPWMEEDETVDYIVDVRMHMLGVGHRSVIRQFQGMEETSAGCFVPRVTAVEKGFWEEKGLWLCEQESHELIMGPS